MDNAVISNYEVFTKRLGVILYNHTAIKLATFRGFKESLETDLIGTTKSFPLLYFMVDSLQVDCVMTISKLVESDRGDKTIQSFLNFISTNQKKIQKKYKGLTKTLIESNQGALDIVNSQISRILIQRDKYYAHSDNKYFLHPNKISDDFPNTYDDLVDILRALQEIVSSHIYVTTSSLRVCMSDFAYLNTFKTIELLNEANKAWVAKYRPNEGLI
jgi:hypothetical protein